MRITGVNSFQPLNAPGAALPVPEAPASPGDGFVGRVRQTEKPGAIRKIWGKLSAGVKKAASITSHLVAVIPTLGSLVAARQLAALEGALGGEKLSAVEWLRKRAPSIYAFDIRHLSGKLDAVTQNAVGLSAADLVEVDKTLYQMLSPLRDENGLKTSPQFLTQLATAGQRDPNDPYPGFVYLGEERKQQAKEIMELWNSPNRPAENPYPESDDRYTCWHHLQSSIKRGDSPVFIDLDNNCNTYSTTDFLAKETVTSLWTRGGRVGNTPRENAEYYTWMTTRLDTFYKTLDPWLKKARPELQREVCSIKRDLTPQWLGGEGIGPFPPQDKVEEACNRFAEIARGPQLALADAAISLDRDLLTGVQSHWIKFMREAGPERRAELFAPLAKAWVELALSDDPCVTPPDGPMLTAFSGNPRKMVQRPYDRAMGLGEVVDHTLNGLGIAERAKFMGMIRQEIREHEGQLQSREKLLRKLLGDEYPGIDVSQVLHGTCDPGDLKPLEAQLTRPGCPSQSKAVRYLDLMDWMVNAEARYGDNNLGVDGSAPQFRENPLAISEFFTQHKMPDCVTPLGTGPRQIHSLGQGEEGGDLSMVFKGGGGKGFCFATCIEETLAALQASGGQFKLDEFSGTSAGAITALLMAAGFSPQEVAQLMNELDFKKFDSDAIWLEGGADPKVRGIDRTGMFSLQKMYTTLYDLLSQKLGVEGRPILFSDLPFKLNISTTVLNTDLPADDPLRQQIDPDGRMVLSTAATPNFDVIAAVIASAAVPGFFDSPQMAVFRGNQRHYIQFCDGGVINNLPVTNTQEAQGLVVMPAHFEATDPLTGEKASLSTLNFDASNLGPINAHNRELYRGFAPQMAQFISQSGNQRTVLAFNLARPEEQPLPLVQGKNPLATARLAAQATQAQMPILKDAQADKVMAANVHPEKTLGKLAGAAFTYFAQAPEADTPLEWHWSGSTAHPGTRANSNLIAMAKGTVAASLAAQHRPFEEA